MTEAPTDFWNWLEDPPDGLRSVRRVDAFPSRDDAEDMVTVYAELLRQRGVTAPQRGVTARFGVFPKRIPGVGWGVFLRDRAARP